MNCIITDARILSQDASGWQQHNSLCVAEGKIARIGSLADCRTEAGPGVQIISLQGRALLPAFTDTHTHLSEYAKLRLQVDLSGQTTLEGVKQVLLGYLDKHPDLPEWILGGGWDKNCLDQPARIDSTWLDAICAKRPIALYSKDYHSRWCNSIALRLSGIDSATPDPPGGKIYRDTRGNPTGILTETAAQLPDCHIPPLPPAELEAALSEALPELHSYGLTTLHCMENAREAQTLERFARASQALRICRHLPLEELDCAIGAGKTSYAEDEWYQTGGLKIFADGSLGSQTAAMFQEYPDTPGNRGILRHEQNELLEIARKAASHGLSCTVHAIGDRAVNAVIGTFLSLREEYPRLLPRIEHLQCVAAEDLPRLKRSGACCSLQPLHLAEDIDLIERYWQPVRSQAYAFRSLLDLGIPFGFGSDAPIASLNPFLGIYSALTRKKLLDPAQPAWLPEQRLSAAEAIHAYTLGAAACSGSQQLAGSIAEGKRADLIVLEDFTLLPDEYWLEARSLLTMVGGRIVHRKGV